MIHRITVTLLRDSFEILKDSLEFFVTSDGIAKRFKERPRLHPIKLQEFLKTF